LRFSRFARPRGKLQCRHWNDKAQLLFFIIAMFGVLLRSNMKI